MNRRLVAHLVAQLRCHGVHVKYKRMKHRGWLRPALPATKLPTMAPCLFSELVSTRGPAFRAALALGNGIGLRPWKSKGQTYELLITQHRPGATNDGKRPPLETRLLFRGIHGRLDWDLSGKDKNKAGTVLPTFYSRAGEEVGIPKRFRPVVCAITQAVHCDGCFHCHYVRPSKKVEKQCTG